MFISIHLSKLRSWLLLILLMLNLLLIALICYPILVDPSTSQTDVQHPYSVSHVELPILMYHDILKSPARQQPYVISPAKLEQDLIFLCDNGYQTVVTQDIVAFVEYGEPLPSKPIMITFDDGYFNNVFYAEPLLKKYQMRAVIFVVGAYCERAVKEGEENPNYSYIQWDRLSQMAEGGIWDIQCHSWNLHAVSGGRMGVQKRSSQSESQYLDALHCDFAQITDKLTEITGSPPLAFAYPYGAMSEQADDVLKELGYKVTVCSNHGKSTLIYGQPETLFRLRRLARVNNRSARSLLTP